MMAACTARFFTSPRHYSYRARNLLSKLRLCIAVYASVFGAFLIGKLKYMLDILLGGRDTTGIFALDDIDKSARHIYILFLCELSALDNIYRCIRTDKTDNVKIAVNA